MALALAAWLDRAARAAAAVSAAIGLPIFTPRRLNLSTRPSAAGCFRRYLTTIVPAMYR